MVEHFASRTLEKKENCWAMSSPLDITLSYVNYCVSSRDRPYHDHDTIFTLQYHISWTFNLGQTSRLHQGNCLGIICMRRKSYMGFECDFCTVISGDSGRMNFCYCNVILYISEMENRFQGKTKGQRLKGKIVSSFFTLFHDFS